MSVPQVKGHGMPPDPLQPILDARKTLASRYQSRRAKSAQDRIASAIETMADEVTLIRAEMEIMRTLLAVKVAEDG